MSRHHFALVRLVRFRDGAAGRRCNATEAIGGAERHSLWARKASGAGGCTADNREWIRRASRQHGRNGAQNPHLIGASGASPPLMITPTGSLGLGGNVLISILAR